MFGMMVGCRNHYGQPWVCKSYEVAEIALNNCDDAKATLCNAFTQSRLFTLISANPPYYKHTLYFKGVKIFDSFNR